MFVFNITMIDYTQYNILDIRVYIIAVISLVITIRKVINMYKSLAHTVAATHNLSIKGFYSIESIFEDSNFKNSEFCA